MLKTFKGFEKLFSNSSLLFKSVSPFGNWDPVKLVKSSELHTEFKEEYKNIERPEFASKGNLQKRFYQQTLQSKVDKKIDEWQIYVSLGKLPPDLFFSEEELPPQLWEKDEEAP